MDDDLLARYAYWKRYAMVFGGALLPAALATTLLVVFSSSWWWMAPFLTFMVLAAGLTIALAKMGEYKEKRDGVP
jgi:uncharacterized membrane protein